MVLFTHNQSTTSNQMEGKESVAKIKTCSKDLSFYRHCLNWPREEKKKEKRTEKKGKNDREKRREEKRREERGEERRGEERREEKESGKDTTKQTVLTLSSSISRCLFVVSAVDTFSVNSLICSQAFVSSVSSWAVLLSRLPRKRLSNSKAVEALVPLLLTLDRSWRMELRSCEESSASLIPRPSSTVKTCLMGEGRGCRTSGETFPRAPNVSFCEEFCGSQHEIVLQMPYIKTSRGAGVCVCVRVRVCFNFVQVGQSSPAKPRARFWANDRPPIWPQIYFLFVQIKHMRFNQVRKCYWENVDAVLQATAFAFLANASLQPQSFSRLYNGEQVTTIRPWYMPLAAFWLSCARLISGQLANHPECSSSPRLFVEAWRSSLCFLSWLVPVDSPVSGALLMIFLSLVRSHFSYQQSAART